MNTEGPIDEESLRGRSCRIAVDLSSKSDITCIVILFPPLEEGGKWIILARFWVPAEGLLDREIRDRVPYSVWVKEGWIKATEGNRVDYRAVLEQLKADAETFNPVDVTFDPWNAGTIEADCTALGMTVVEFPQRTSHYAYPTKEFLEMLPDCHFEHGGNPVLAWMASNLVLVKDHNDNPMPSKKNSIGRIDGIAATIMAMGRALGGAEEEFVTRGLLII
jgi:phage terminase large subunit-like protein